MAVVNKEMMETIQSLMADMREQKAWIVTGIHAAVYLEYCGS